jgi:serine/threonine protein kinase
VYQGYDNATGKAVAVKFLVDDRYLWRFKHEVELGYQLNISNVAATIRWELNGEAFDNGMVVKYLVMKWISGKALSEIIRENAKAPKPTKDMLAEAANWLRKIGRALDTIHDKRIYHRDLKPSNIRFNSDQFEKDEPYLLDFGIAKHMPLSTADRSTDIEEEGTMVGEYPGTIRYMPPEQWDGLVDSGRSDQYALAATIYEFLTDGRSPFEEAIGLPPPTGSSKPSTSDTAKVYAWQKAHRETPPKPIQEYRRDIPQAVWLVLQRALNKNQARRYESVDEFTREFVQAVENPKFVPSSVLEQSSTAKQDLSEFRRQEAEKKAVRKEPEPVNTEGTMVQMPGVPEPGMEARSPGRSRVPTPAPVDAELEEEPRRRLPPTPVLALIGGAAAVVLIGGALLLSGGGGGDTTPTPITAIAEATTPPTAEAAASATTGSTAIPATSVPPTAVAVANTDSPTSVQPVVPTNTEVPSETPTATSTWTFTATFTDTPRPPTNTATLTATATETPTALPTDIPTNTPSYTATSVPPTDTVVPPTATSIPPTATSLPTSTPLPTETPLPTATPSNTPLPPTSTPSEPPTATPIPELLITGVCRAGADAEFVVKNISSSAMSAPVNYYVLNDTGAVVLSEPIQLAGGELRIIPVKGYYGQIRLSILLGTTLFTASVICQEPTATDTDTPVPTATHTPTATPLPPTATPTPTNTPRATNTPTRTATPAPLTATANAAAAEVAALERQATPIASVRSSGQLRHQPNDNAPETYQPSGVNVRNFVASVTFTVPYAGDWDFGILFRVTTRSRYRLVVASDTQNWNLFWERAGARSQKTNTGPLGNLRVAEGDTNTLKIVVQEETGYLYLNGDLLEVVSLLGSDRATSISAGGISLSIGNYADMEQTGAVTAYSDFIVSKLP